VRCLGHFRFRLKGGATRVPLYARVDGLVPRMSNLPPRARTAGHLSGSDRAARCPTGRPAARATLVGARLVGGVNELVKYADIAYADVAQRSSPTIVEITSGIEGLAASASRRLFSERMRLTWGKCNAGQASLQAAMSAKSRQGCSTFGQSLPGPSASRRGSVSGPESPDFLGDRGSRLGTMTATIASPA